ncbi:RNA helicase [Chitiniphilus shinanonensis]|uniref:RNA helicase n=1 Tax=Chitiniphilus shinanonensis TaxID=553088 RepID=A0ABQ6BVL8_9NEIS|nr:DEAD/DEAH box helicase [Chitiniphilus shinanonensis]GLS05539.1 RNA helicase [Chitiniphilus shinanonensis]
MPFTALGLIPALARAAQQQQFHTPTPIQAAAIPAVLQGRDVLLQARTGSGKTAAFGLPLLQRVHDARGDGPRRWRGLVLAPTRELAMQIGATLTALAAQLPRPLKIMTVYGGVSINPQMMALRGGADIVVATPGRLLDLLDRNALRADDVATVVLDEADRLLDLGFADELADILAQLPATRQTLLCSATLPTQVDTLAASQLRDPCRVAPDDAPQDLAAIEQRAIAVDTARRAALLVHLLRETGWAQALVFVATQHTTEHLAAKLAQAGIAAAAFHGDLGQGRRIQVLSDFKAGRLPVVICTDVAARGIDIAQLPAVVNYDLPRSTADYVHRIGRTGRAGEHGVAVSFVAPGHEAHWQLIEKRQGRRVPREIVAGFEPKETTPTTPGPGGIKGRRKSKKDKLREAAAAAGGNPKS